jgi:predicted ATP-grasp superfamily ATP-dependent carboligase
MKRASRRTDMGAIILDGQLKSALIVVRSLGRRGIRVSVGAEHGTAMSLHSRYTSRTFTYPSPYSTRTAFVESLVREASALGGKPVVYAMSDATFMAVHAHRDELAQHLTLLFPDEHAMGLAFDKAGTYALARFSSVPTPATYFPATREEVEVLGKELTYPAVSKARRSLTMKDGQGIFGSASFVWSSQELASRFSQSLETLGEAPIIQEYVPRDEYGVEAMTLNGKVGALVVHHRIRSLSPTGGASVLKETLAPGPLYNELTGYAEKLIQELAWSGPIMCEFKVSDTREPKLIEINGRFWGSLPLSVAAGVDMPHLYYELLGKGELPSPRVEGRAGVITRHFLGDVRHLLRVLFARDRLRSLRYPKRRQALRDFFRLPPRTESDVWSMGDPAPALMEVVDTCTHRLWK